MAALNNSFTAFDVVSKATLKQILKNIISWPRLNIKKAEIWWRMEKKLFPWEAARQYRVIGRIKESGANLGDTS